MRSISKYFEGLFRGIFSLLTGMSVTWKELWTKKVTQQYPENRETLVISDRFRCELVMPHDENNEHACTACGICEMNCPNGTIQVISKMIETEDGKKKKILDRHVWDLGMCTFCNLCVITCPSDAIMFNNNFENAVFTRSKLVQQLNHEGSKMREKKREVKPVTPASEKVVEKTPEIKAEPTIEVKASKPVELLIEAIAESKSVKAAEPTPETAAEVKSSKPVTLLVEAIAESKEAETEKPAAKPVVKAVASDKAKGTTTPDTKSKTTEK